VAPVCDGDSPPVEDWRYLAVRFVGGDARSFMAATILLEAVRLTLSSLRRGPSQMQGLAEARSAKAAVTAKRFWALTACLAEALAKAGAAPSTFGAAMPRCEICDEVRRALERLRQAPDRVRCDDAINVEEHLHWPFTLAMPTMYSMLIWFQFWSGLDLRLAQRRHFLDTVTISPLDALFRRQRHLHDHDAGPLRQGGFKAELDAKIDDRNHASAKIDDPFYEVRHLRDGVISASG